MTVKLNDTDVEETNEVSNPPKGIFIPLNFRNAAVFAGASAIAASVITAAVCRKTESGDDAPREIETVDVPHDSEYASALNE